MSSEKVSAQADFLCGLYYAEDSKNDLHIINVMRYIAACVLPIHDNHCKNKTKGRICMVRLMAKRASIPLTDDDEAAIKVVMRRYGQQSEAGVIRLCLHMVAQAAKIELQSPMGSREGLTGPAVE